MIKKEDIKRHPWGNSNHGSNEHGDWLAMEIVEKISKEVKKQGGGDDGLYQIWLKNDLSNFEYCQKKIKEILNNWGWDIEMTFYEGRAEHLYRVY